MAKIPEGYEAVVPEGYEVVSPAPQEERAVTTPLEGAMTTAGNQMQNVAEGALLGWRDEAEAKLTNMVTGEPYRDALSRIEARRAESNIGNDYETAAKLAGGLFTGAATAGVVNPSTITGTAILGGIEGGIAGAGLSEGNINDVSQLATDTALGFAAGTVAGPLVGATANIAYRGLKPMSQRIAGWIRGTAEDARITTQQRNLNTAKELGIKTTYPERSGDAALMAKQARYQTDEILNKAVQPTYDARQATVNQVARKEVGLPPADDINRFDLGNAAKDISNKFKSIEGEYGTAKLDDDLFNKLDSLVTTKSIIKPPQKATDAVTRTMEMLDEGMSGKQYLQQRSLLDKEIQGIYKAEKPDVRLAETYSEIIDILDDKFASQLQGKAALTLKDARYKWKNLRLLDRPNAVKGGNVSLPQVKTGLNRNKSFLRGLDESPLAKLADFQDSTNFQFGRSGTPERSPFNVLQKAQSTLELPFANANISRGGLIPGLIDIPGASQAGGLASTSAVPPLVIGTKDGLNL